MIEREEYLGDGVYASWDGWHIWLDTRAESFATFDGYGKDPISKIALEPSVISSLIEYMLTFPHAKEIISDKLKEDQQ